MDPETELTHFLGKDNIVFHTIIFPAMLHAHGDFIVPTNVPANEFLEATAWSRPVSRRAAAFSNRWFCILPVGIRTSTL